MSFWSKIYVNYCNFARSYKIKFATHPIYLDNCWNIFVLLQSFLKNMFRVRGGKQMWLWCVLAKFSEESKYGAYVMWLVVCVEGGWWKGMGGCEEMWRWMRGWECTSSKIFCFWPILSYQKLFWCSITDISDGPLPYSFFKSAGIKQTNDLHFHLSAKNWWDYLRGCYFEFRFF